ELSVPDDLTATVESSSKINLDWDSVSDATSYYIYRATSSSGSFTKIASVTTTSYTNSGLSDDTTYYYKVKAVNSSGTSAYSAVVHATTKN
ncbi:fibronectin type III domain-containing protein, partial [Desulfosporosinus sp. BG]|uniref:fibronectin type III domain-containing protein n=1 Tax=Desulfosporosinus sp. BG TaxID=1633135 RepID=UPI000AD4CDDC